MRPRRPAASSGDSPSFTPAQTRAAALRLLGRREYTSTEVSARLIDRGHAEPVVATVVAGLRAEGLLDDARAAHAHVRTASRLKGRGVLRIRRELQARGLADATIREALGEISADDDARAIEQVLARRRVSKASPMAERQRAFQHLLRRGFAADAIAKALRLRDED